jgi:putative glycosyltransferase (TIGR04372 family)
MKKMNLFFHLIKPLNPIDLWDYKVTKKNSLFRRLEIIFFTFKNFLIKREFSHLRFCLIYLFLFFKQLILNILSILYLPFAIILYFCGFKFLHVSYWQIGTLSFQIDILVKEIVLNNRNYNLKKIIFLCPKYFSSNTGLLNLYKSKITLIENILSNIIFLPFLQIHFVTINPFYIEHNIKLSKSHKIYTEYEKNINKNIFSFSPEDQVKIEHMLENKIPDLKKKKIICLHTRNENFYNETNLTSRNASFEKYIDTINFLTDQNYYVIRFVDKKSSFKKKNYFELITHDKDGQIFQIYLIYKCLFFISSASGPAFLTNLFKKPSLCTNFFPYSQLIGYNKFDLTIPKKIYSTIEKRYLKFSEIFNSNKYLIASSRILERKFLEVHQNEDKVILQSSQEMLKNLTNPRLEQTDLQIKFKNIVSPKAGCYFGQGNISNTFLENNKDLLN